MANSLTRLRRAFGWSQDAMAATLGVDLRTIKRWEAVEPPNVSLFMDFVWRSISRYSMRMYRYGRAILPPEYFDEVQASTFERSVYIGPEAVVLAMSNETRRTWGIFRHAEGLSVSAFSSKPERELLAEYYPVMKEICSAGDSTRLVHFVTSEAPLGSTPPLWRLHIMQARFPEIFDMISIPITEKQYREANPKLWISQRRPGPIKDSEVFEIIGSIERGMPMTCLQREQLDDGLVSDLTVIPPTENGDLVRRPDAQTPIHK